MTSVRRHNWVCYAYCLMDNYYHLLIETPEGNLSKGMRQVGAVYTQAYNSRHNKSGHLFQGRYKAILVERESHLLEVIRYVLLNPVRAGTAKTPESWPWSSYRGTCALEEIHPCLSVRPNGSGSNWVLAQFGGKRREAAHCFRSFVNDGISAGSPFDNVKGQIQKMSVDGAACCSSKIALTCPIERNRKKHSMRSESFWVKSPSLSVALHDYPRGEPGENHG